MKRALILTVGLLCGCGGSDEEAAPGMAADANQIERLSTPPEKAPDPQAGARLDPITLEDLDQAGLLGAGCAFTRGDRILLASVGSDAIVRFNGQIRHLIHSATVGPTGGFFEDRQLSISVGRRSEEGTTQGEETRWPARMTVTNRRTQADRKIDGEWTCGA